MPHNAMRYTPPSSCLQGVSRKGTASLHIKVDTGAGGNVLPLCVF